MIVYLSGAMEFAEDEGADWRKDLSNWLENNLGHKVFDPVVNSKKLIKHAVKDGANYIAIGAFFKSKTKKINYIAKPGLISWVKRFTKIPIVVIGGINNKNFRKLLLHKPDFLAISGGIWDKKPAKAIREFL